MSVRPSEYINSGSCWTNFRETNGKPELKKTTQKIQICLKSGPTKLGTLHEELVTFVFNVSYQLTNVTVQL